MENNKSLRIAIPLAEGKLCMHFGHCKAFALFDVNSETGQIANKQFLTPPPHEPGVLPRWLAEKETNLVISGGMGAKAQSLFLDSGVRVITGACFGDPEDIVKAYLDGTLKPGSNTCGHGPDHQCP